MFSATSSSTPAICHTDDVGGTEFKMEFETHRDVHVNTVEVLMACHRAFHRCAPSIWPGISVRDMGRARSFFCMCYLAESGSRSLSRRELYAAVLMGAEPCGVY